MEDTKVYRSADIGSDHYLVCATVKPRLRKDPEQKGNVRVKYDISKLTEEDVRNTFSIKLRNRFQALEQEDDKKRGRSSRCKGRSGKGFYCHEKGILGGCGDGVR